MNSKENSTTAAGGARPRSPQEQAFEAAILALKVAAIAMDPAIKGMWVSYMCRPGEPFDGAVEAIIFDRSGKAHALAQEGGAA